MTEAELFAAIGRKQVEVENLSLEYDRLLLLLNQVVSGVTPIADVTVDLAARSWTLKVQKPEADPLISGDINVDN